MHLLDACEYQDFQFQNNKFHIRVVHYKIYLHDACRDDQLVQVVDFRSILKKTRKWLMGLGSGWSQGVLRVV